MKTEGGRGRRQKPVRLHAHEFGDLLVALFHAIDLALDPSLDLSLDHAVAVDPRFRLALALESSFFLFPLSLRSSSWSYSSSSSEL